MSAVFDPENLRSAGTCDRRRFLGCSAALALGALAGRTAHAFRPEPVVVALGGAGINVARRVHADGLTARYWIWNRQGQPGNGVHLAGAHRVDIPAQFLDRGAEARLLAWVSRMLDLPWPPSNRVAVVAGLGGGTGSALLPAVVRELSARGLRVGAYCTLPATFEGTPRRLQAEGALAALAATGAIPWLVRLEDVLRSTPRGTSLRRFLEEADGRLARPMRRFLSAR